METVGQIATPEALFEPSGMRAKGLTCDTVDRILEEGEGLLKNFGDSVVAGAVITLSRQAVAYCEITRYRWMRAFAEALGMGKTCPEGTLARKGAADSKLIELAEGSGQ